MFLAWCLSGFVIILTEAVLNTGKIRVGDIVLATICSWFGLINLIFAPKVAGKINDVVIMKFRS